jgi:hypothetical protein
MIEKIITKLKIIFIPCQENKYLPKFLERKFLNYYLIFLLILKIISFSLIIYLPQNIFFADITKTALINLINQDRKKLGLSTLNENQKLEEAASLKAKDILEKDYFSHWSPDGISPWYWLEKVGYNYQSAGENLAIGFLDSKEVYEAWMNSPSHRANILNPNYQEIGISVLKGDFQGNEVFVVVQYFGSPKVQKIRESTQPLEKGVSPPPSPEKEVLPAEKEVLPSEIEQKKIANESQRKITLNLVKFANLKYHYILEIIICFSLVLLIFSLIVTIFFDIFIYRRFIIDYKELIPRTLVFIFLLVLFLYLDKLTIIKLLPHVLLI